MAILNQLKNIIFYFVICHPLFIIKKRKQNDPRCQRPCKIKKRDFYRNASPHGKAKRYFLCNSIFNMFKFYEIPLGINRYNGDFVSHFTNLAACTVTV